MQISYGTPSPLRGVTTLVAVGAVEDDYAHGQRAMKIGAGVAAAVLGLGVLARSRTLRHVGAGGLLALLAVRAASR